MNKKNNKSEPHFDEMLTDLYHSVDLYNADINKTMIARQLIKAKYDYRYKIYCLAFYVNLPVAEYMAKSFVRQGYKAEAMHLGELKHGTLASISEFTKCIIFNPDSDDPTYDNSFRDTYSCIKMIASKQGSWSLVVAHEKRDGYSQFVRIPKLKYPMLYPLVQMVTAEVIIGWVQNYDESKRIVSDNPDKPRNIAKSVTVR